MSPPPPPIFYTSQIALSLQDPTLASPDFFNATGNGADYWKLLTYAQFSNSIDRGYALQESFAHINTDNPDLSAFKAKGGKLVMMHGLNDAVIPAQGSINYYNRVASKMNGIDGIQDFYRFYLIPGFGHGVANGTTNSSANPPTPGGRQIYDLVVDWVEKGAAPADRIELTPATQGGPTAPACAYPKKRTYVSGDINLSASYSCS